MEVMVSQVANTYIGSVQIVFSKLLPDTTNMLAKDVMYSIFLVQYLLSHLK